MKHVLGGATFEVLDGFRDDSTYMYQSPDERDLAQVTPMPDAADANDISKSSTAALDGFYGSALIYTRPKQAADDLPHPAFLLLDTTRHWDPTHARRSNDTRAGPS
jgi:hypothetical protein